jgi:hypothetical protein
MSTASIKNELKDLAERLPGDVTWMEVLAEVYARARIEQGIRDLDEGRWYTTEQVKERLGIND